MAKGARALFPTFLTDAQLGILKKNMKTIKYQSKTAGTNVPLIPTVKYVSILQSVNILRF